MANKKMSLIAVAVLMALTQGVQAQDAPQEEPAAPEEQSATTLDAVQVQATFVAQGARSAMKQDLTVMETPYSVASYSDDFMKAIETASIADLYNYMTGVRRGGNTGYDISIRGFKSTNADKGAIMVDGLPGVSGRFGSPPTFAAQGIEVVKGPASVLYGSGQPGGFVNIITKKPLAKREAQFDFRGTTYTGAGISFGDANGYSLGLDMTGPLDERETILYRFVTEYGDRDGFRYDSWNKSLYLAPSFTFRISDYSELRTAFEYRNQENSYDSQYLVAPNKDASKIANIRTRYQEPGDTAEETGYSATVAYSHYFQNGATLNLANRTVHGEENVQGYDIVSVLADGVTLRRRPRQQYNQRDYNYFDGSLALPFATGPVEHKALVGLTYGSDNSDFERVQFYDCAATGPNSVPGPGRCNVSVYNPVLGVAPPLSAWPLGVLNRRITTNTSSGVYVSDLMSLTEKWKFNLGLRYANEKQVARLRQPPLAPPTRTSVSSSKLLPTAGLLFMPTHEWTVYASYSTSYIPQAAGAQDAAGTPNPFDPQEGNQVEVGVKAELLGGRLNTTFALYDIEKINSLATAPCNPGVTGVCSQQVGAERSKGAEFEVNYAITENLQLIGGWAYTDAYVSETYNSPNAPLVGSQLTNSSKHSGHVWTRYDFKEGALRNFGIGAGVNYNSETPGSLPSAADPRVLILPSYTVADLAFYYKLRDKYDFTLKIGNVFDEYYFEGVNTTTNENGVVPGSPRNVTFSVRIPLW